MDHLSDKRFMANEVSIAADLPKGGLQNWLTRGILWGQEAAAKVDGGGSSGKHRRFTLENIMQIAIARELVARHNVAPKEAARAAVVFSFTGSDGRKPAYPFPDGITYVVCDGETGRVIKAQAKGIDFSEIPCFRLMDSFTVINASNVFQKVMKRLGYDSRDVLEAAYAGGEA